MNDFLGGGQNNFGGGFGGGGSNMWNDGGRGGSMYPGANETTMPIGPRPNIGSMYPGRPSPTYPGMGPSNPGLGNAGQIPQPRLNFPPGGMQQQPKFPGMPPSNPIGPNMPRDSGFSPGIQPGMGNQFLPPPMAMSSGSGNFSGPNVQLQGGAGPQMMIPPPQNQMPPNQMGPSNPMMQQLLNGPGNGIGSGFMAPGMQLGGGFTNTDTGQQSPIGSGPSFASQIQNPSRIRY